MYCPHMLASISIKSVFMTNQSLGTKMPESSSEGFLPSLLPPLSFPSFSFFFIFFLSFSIRTSHFSIPQGNALSPLSILCFVSLILFWSLTNHSFSEIPYKDPVSMRNSWDEKSMSKWAMNCARGGHNIRKVLVSLCWGSFSGGERRQLHWKKELRKVDLVLAMFLLWWPHSVRITNW